VPRPLPREAWLADAADRFATLEAWRRAHPRATWEEIESAIDAQFAPLRARVVGDTVLVSDAADLGTAPAPCPECGTPLQPAGRHRRRARTEGDVPIELERAYGRCPACGAGGFPPR
jgi:hypothetical protein